MVDQSTRDRVDAFWSSTLDTAVADLHAPGVWVRANPPARRGWRGIYVLAFEGVTVYTPEDLLDRVSGAVGGLSADQVIESRTWQELLGGVAQTVFGPVRHYYLDRTDGLAERAAGRRLNPTDSDALGKLRTALPAQEWQVTGFTGQPAMLFGIFEGEELIAAANLTAGPSVPRGPGEQVSPEAATDVGIVIHPDARGRGYGGRIAALAARQAIAMYGVARYRALTSNPSTVAIADRLGFQEYGRNLVAYLNDHPHGADEAVPVV
ncbi:MAG TPA: GNAT family N-acetyltransferase [Micromonosporaceae bacterium]|jgi:GNAT superfamily N-acetyltransferase